MKKGLIVGVCFLLILTLFVSFVSAGFFSDFWNKVTGKYIEPIDLPRENGNGETYCHDVCPSGYECGLYYEQGCFGLFCGDCTGEEVCDFTTNKCVFNKCEVEEKTCDKVQAYPRAIEPFKGQNPKKSDCENAVSRILCTNFCVDRVSCSGNVLSCSGGTSAKYSYGTATGMVWDRDLFRNDCFIDCLCSSDSGDKYWQEVSVEPEPETQLCTDSDEGVNYNSKGTANAGSTTATDKCVSTIRLTEYYCDSAGKVLSQSYDCPSECLDGACVERKTESVCQSDLDCGEGYYCENGDCLDVPVTCDSCIPVGGIWCKGSTTGDFCDMYLVEGESFNCQWLKGTSLTSCTDPILACELCIASNPSSYPYWCDGVCKFIYDANGNRLSEEPVCSDYATLVTSTSGSCFGTEILKEVVPTTCSDCISSRGLWCTNAKLANKDFCDTNPVGDVSHACGYAQGTAVSSCPTTTPTCSACTGAGNLWCGLTDSCISREDVTNCGNPPYSTIVGYVDNCPSTTPTCADSDGGFDPFNKGSITTAEGTFHDGCAGTILYERICDPSLAEPHTSAGLIILSKGGYRVTVTCPNGCLDGACKEEVPECTTETYDWSKLGITDENIKRYFKAITAKCGLSFKVEILDSLPSGYEFGISNRRIVKILNITSSAPSVGALLDFTLNESELNFPADNITVYIEKSKTDWLPVTSTDRQLSTTSDENVKKYSFNTDHFSLFLITEPDDYCGNSIFEPTFFEECDGSVNCNSECACDSGYIADNSGFCLLDISGTDCSTEGDENCVGYTLYECDEDLEWDLKGYIVEECEVECAPIGNTSCSGEYPLRCGSDYTWTLQSKINGLCGYTTTPLIYEDGDDLTYCGNGYCGYDEDEFSCPEDCEAEKPSKKWMLPFVIIVISLLILFIVFVLFKIYRKEKRRPMHDPNRRIPPEHRPGPKRPPGRPPVIHHGQIGRPLERRPNVGRPPAKRQPVNTVTPEGYAVKRYPVRRYPPK